jgi:hypothetical protein
MSPAMGSYDRLSRSFQLVCVEEGERVGSPTGDERRRVSVLRSALCISEGRSIELSGEDVEKALLNWLLLLTCVVFILFLVISSGRCFEHER